MVKAVNQNLDFGSGSESDVLLDITQIEPYKEKLKTDIIKRAKDQLDDYQPIVDVIGQNWNGVAAQNFVDALDRNIEQCKQLLDEVGEGMLATVDLAHDTFVSEDENLIDASGFGVF